MATAAAIGTIPTTTTTTTTSDASSGADTGTTSSMATATTFSTTTTATSTADTETTTAARNDRPQEEAAAVDRLKLGDHQEEALEEEAQQELEQPASGSCGGTNSGSCAGERKSGLGRRGFSLQSPTAGDPTHQLFTSNSDRPNCRARSKSDVGCGTSTITSGDVCRSLSPTGVSPAATSPRSSAAATNLRNFKKKLLGRGSKKEEEEEDREEKELNDLKASREEEEGRRPPPHQSSGSSHGGRRRRSHQRPQDQEEELYHDGTQEQEYLVGAIGSGRGCSVQMVMEERPERPLIRYIDCEDDSDFYTGLVPAPDVIKGGVSNNCDVINSGIMAGGSGGHRDSHHQAASAAAGYSPQHHQSGSGGSSSNSAGMGGVGNQPQLQRPMVDTYVTTNATGTKAPSLRVSTSGSQTYPPGQLDLPERSLIGGSSRGVGYGTPPSPETPSSMPRSGTKKTRFLHPAGADLKSPTAGFLEPNREGGWGWAVLLTASLSHAINGGLALASPVLISHITATFNGTTTLQAAVAVSTSWGAGTLLSPLIAAICLKYGPRSVCVLGGFVAALGALFNSFSEQLVHVFIAFSLIFSLGVAMCNQASRIALRAYFRKSHRGKSRVYHSAPYVGAMAYAYFICAAIQSGGWLRGLQITTVTVAANFVLGLFFSKSRYSSRNGFGPLPNGRKGCESGGYLSSPFSFRDCFGLEVLREPCAMKWLAIEASTCLVLRSPLLLMVTDNLDVPSKYGAPVGAVCIMVWGGCAVVGAFVWRISKRWLPVSPLLFLREQLLLMCVIVMGMGITSSVDAYIVTCAAMGLVYGGLDSTLNLQTARLVPAAQRNCAEGWAACFRGVALIIGSPIAVYINIAAGCRWPGYLLCGCVYTIAVCVLLVFMGDIRERELDMQPPPPSAAPRPPILLEVTPAAPNNAGGAPGSGDQQEYEVDPTKLHPDEEMGLVGDLGHQDGAGITVGGANGAGIVLGYLGDDQVRAVDTGDYRWAKIFTGVDAYTGRLLLCKSYEGGPGGGAGDGGEYTEMAGHPRKRGYSEPALPVLQEYPSQENSSLSRADNSVLSLGLKDPDAISATRADGCSIVNTSYDGGGEDFDDFGDGSGGARLPRKMSDNSLFKERISKGTMTPSSAAAVASSAVQRLSFEAATTINNNNDRVAAASESSGTPLLAYANFSPASHASSGQEEELKLLENEASKSCYGTTTTGGAGGIFEKQCSLEGAVGGGVTGGVPPETLVETTV